MSNHYEVTVTTIESFSVHATDEEEAIDLTQEKMSNEQGALIDVSYEVEECLSESQEMDMDEERTNGIEVGFAHKDVKKEREDDES